jgi:hypothetical protein
VTKRQHVNHDPYSWAMARIVPTLTRALTREGSMSDDEFATLIAIKALIQDRDPASLNLTATSVNLVP